ncbi:MAG: helix-turn-helix domain-containing protein [Opitutae bacterium]|jgi:AraC family L-rhamnose operon transcriptional activator RhaR|nr:helix-turn-helix domain-containing protein [Opitutae bacterium]
MNKFQPIFLEDLRISIPGYSILRLAHHRHTPKSDLIEEHTHLHSQFLLYLRGQGIQTLNNKPMPVRRGALLYFPPGTPHGFIKSMKSPPLSLVINFKENRTKNVKGKNKVLLPVRLSEIESILNQMIQSVDLNKAHSILASSQILQIFSLLFNELDEGNIKNRTVYPVTGKVRRLLNELPIIPKAPNEIAQILEEDLSSLNRKVRRESALNLGILLDEARQKRSYEGLKKENLHISKIAWDCGFTDPNYFARWFRKKVGQSPRQWREGNS